MDGKHQYLRELHYYTQGFERYVVLLVGLAILTGCVDAFSIALLYPLLSEGFQISSGSIPFYDIIEQIASFIPIGSTFVHLGLLFVALTCLSLGLQLIYWKIAFFFKRNVVIKVKTSLFEKIDSNDYRFFVDIRQGDIITLFNQSPTYIEQSFDRIISFSADVISTALIIGMLFFISSGGLTLIICGGGIFYLLINKIGKNISEKLGRLQISSGQSENKVINEYISGVHSIKALSSSQHWADQYKNALMIYWDHFAELMFIQRIPIIAINSLFYILVGIIILFLYIFYAEHFMSIIPVLGTFAAGAMKILPKAINLGEYHMQLKNYRPHVHHVYTCLHDHQYESVKNGNISFIGLSSDIIFEDVSFSYGKVKILNNLHVTIKKGAVTALVGPSGSGKSTFAALLLRLYDPNDGQILLNGIPFQEYDVYSFRDNIGYVGQEPFIFNSTVRENITFGNDYSDYDVKSAAILAQAHEFISLLPNGYDTLVGDQGVTLSGGEKQRIVIARAMIRKPELLILDEATSALDNVSEMFVQKAIDSVTQVCTTLVIAHRLTSVQNADLIYVLKNGVIMEEGNHSDLILKKGRYYEMYYASEKSSERPIRIE